MDSITVSSYRCFGGEQTGRLAPITLLVGENSTGKSSLMAMIRAMWDAVYADRVPNFKEEPYDLGSFDEIVHDTGGRGTRAESFAARFEVRHLMPGSGTGSKSYRAEVEFGPQHAAPAPVRRRISSDGYWLEQDLSQAGFGGIRCGSPQGEWRREAPDGPRAFAAYATDVLPPLDSAMWQLRRGTVENRPAAPPIEPLPGSPEFTTEIAEEIEQRISRFSGGRIRQSRRPARARPFASAPTRSRPRRTYDPARVAPDAEGDYVPTYLAWLSLHEPDAWKQLKYRLEEFGSAAGLFDEITVRRLGKTASHPFQIQVRKHDKRRKGPLHNLADMGYGVSQVLPLATELLRDDSPREILVQQPEVHLHPSAEAALGTLLCEVAVDRRRDRRLIVETHSDFIIDRVRMSVRDGLGGLKPKDVSILYFERSGLDATIHTLRVDERGNLLNVPPGYRQFFLKELQRSIDL